MEGWHFCGPATTPCELYEGLSHFARRYFGRISRECELSEENSSRGHRCLCSLCCASSLVHSSISGTYSCQRCGAATALLRLIARMSSIRAMLHFSAGDRVDGSPFSWAFLASLQEWKTYTQLTQFPRRLRQMKLPENSRRQKRRLYIVQLMQNQSRRGGKS